MTVVFNLRRETGIRVLHAVYLRTGFRVDLIVENCLMVARQLARFFPFSLRSDEALLLLISFYALRDLLSHFIYLHLLHV